MPCVLLGTAMRTPHRFGRQHPSLSQRQEGEQEGQRPPSVSLSAASSASSHAQSPLQENPGNGLTQRERWTLNSCLMAEPGPPVSVVSDFTRWPQAHPSELPLSHVHPT